LFSFDYFAHVITPPVDYIEDVPKVH
jgi:hypothetical protein